MTTTIRAIAGIADATPADTAYLAILRTESALRARLKDACVRIHDLNGRIAELECELRRMRVCAGLCDE